MYRSFVAVAVLALVSPITALAQAPIDSALRRVRAGRLIRLRMLDGQLLESRLVELQGATMQFRLLGHEAPLPAASVDSLWVRGRATKTGALAGAIAVTVPSFIFWASNCDAIDEVPSCDSDDWAFIAGFTLVPAGIGALIGALIGSRAPKWRLHFAREPGPPNFSLTLARPSALGLSFEFE